MLLRGVVIFSYMHFKTMVADIWATCPTLKNIKSVVVRLSSALNTIKLMLVKPIRRPNYYCRKSHASFASMT